MGFEPSVRTDPQSGAGPVTARVTRIFESVHHSILFEPVLFYLVTAGLSFFFQNSKLRIGDRLAFRQSVLGVLFTILAGERIIITSWEPLGVGRDESVDSRPWSNIKRDVLQNTPQ